MSRVRFEQIGSDVVAAATSPVVELTCVYPLSSVEPGTSFKQLCAAHAVVAVR